MALMLATTIPLVVALGDSVTYGYGLPVPATQNYAALYTRRIHGSLVNLAVPGAQCDDVVDNQIPKMPRGASIVILNCGINDVGGFGLTAEDKPDGVKRTAAASQGELAAAQQAFTHALALIRRAEPGAKIYVVNLRHWQRMTGPEARQFAQDVSAWNAMVAASGLSVVDVSGDPRMYQLDFFRADLLHPNTEGNAAMASDFH